MYRYRFHDGSVVTSKLNKDEILKRMNRLDTLRVLTEGHEEGEGYSICQKALRAYNKLEDFTGIIRLTASEKDWLSYKLESPYNTEEDIKCIKFYCGIA